MKRKQCWSKVWVWEEKQIENTLNKLELKITWITVSDNENDRTWNEFWSISDKLTSSIHNNICLKQLCFLNDSQCWRFSVHFTIIYRQVKDMERGRGRGKNRKTTWKVKKVKRKKIVKSGLVWIGFTVSNKNSRFFPIISFVFCFVFHFSFCLLLFCMFDPLDRESACARKPCQPVWLIWWTISNYLSLVLFKTF